MNEFVPKKLVDDIAAVQRKKGVVFDTVKVLEDTVLLMQGDNVVFQHRVVTPGNYK